MSKKILITGGAGFVGSNLAIFLKKNLKDDKICCLDNLIRSGSEINKKRLEDNGIKFIHGDVRDKKKLLALPEVNMLIDCCAEPSVLASYEDPQYCIDTNLIGTINCLELAKRDRADFIFLSSSRVYPIAALNDLDHKELSKRLDWDQKIKGPGYSHEGIGTDFTLAGPKSLYGATKLASEHIIQEYADMYGFKSVINRLGVVAGPWQMGRIDQGIVGYWVIRHKYAKDLSYIGFGGTGKQVRDVVHVHDVCELILHELLHMDDVNGRIFNAGGGRKNSVSLLELTEITQRVIRRKMEIKSDLRDRQGDIRIYITDNRAIHNELGWTARKDVETIVADVNLWLDQNEGQLRGVFS